MAQTYRYSYVQITKSPTEKSPSVPNLSLSRLLLPCSLYLDPIPWHWRPTTRCGVYHLHVLRHEVRTVVSPLDPGAPNESLNMPLGHPSRAPIQPGKLWPNMSCRVIERESVAKARIPQEQLFCLNSLLECTYQSIANFQTRTFESG